MLRQNDGAAMQLIMVAAISAGFPFPSAAPVPKRIAAPRLQIGEGTSVLQLDEAAHVSTQTQSGFDSDAEPTTSSDAAAVALLGEEAGAAAEALSPPTSIDPILEAGFAATTAVTPSAASAAEPAVPKNTEPYVP